jgi:putative membrane-bound dehydrogenase-like protein
MMNEPSMNRPLFLFLCFSSVGPILRGEELAKALPGPGPVFSVPDGLAVRPFATEQQLFNPASIDVDHRGRVWVAEALNYRKKARPTGDRILILEDRDRDGRADTSKVFYEHPDIDGVHGLCVLGNTVIVSVSDRILILIDTDGDDRADEKKILFKGKVTQGPHGQHDHAIHAVMFGPDGRLYFNFGNYNAGLWHEDGTPVVDHFGIPVDNRRQPYQEGMVLRCELDGSRVEVLGHNFRNNWEVTVDSFGSLWQSDNDNGSSSCRVNFVMEHGNYGYRDERTGADYHRMRSNMESTMQRRMWHQNDPGVVPNLLITGTGAPTGILVYEGDLLPKQFHGQMIHAEPGRNVVWSFPATPKGAGYTATVVDIARSTKDRNYRPSDVSVAPDGSLIIADWFDPVDCCHRTENDAGRLFRVAPPGHPYTIPTFDFDSPQGATQALRNPNLSVRYEAWTALLGMQARAEPALKAMAADANPRFRARALWALAARKTGPMLAIERALKDDSPDIRALALRIARRHELSLEPLVGRLVRDSSALVRRECAVSLHRLTSPAAVKLWVDLAAQHDGIDRWYLEALGIGEQGKEAACLEQWLKRAGSTWNSPAGRDLVWRSRAPKAAGLIAKLLLDPELPAEEHPRFLRALDFHSLEAQGSAIAALLSSDSDLNPATYLEIFQRASPAFLQTHPEVSKKAESALLASVGTVAFVDLVARFNKREMIGKLLEMAQAKPEREPGIRALQQVLAFGEKQRVASALRDRKGALSMITALGFVDRKDAVDLLRAVAIDEKQPDDRRLGAIRAIARSKTGGQQLVRMVKREEVAKRFLRTAIQSLASSADPGPRLFAAQQQALLPPLANRPSLQELLAAKPNLAMGKVAFQKAGCSACHLVNGEGIDFGPELSAIGTKLTAEQLFTAILDPSQSITLGYEGVQVETKDGPNLVGFVISESETTLHLRLPGGLQRDLELTTIKTRKPMKQSLMPAGLETAISSQELVDLVEWLRTLPAAKERSSLE